MQNQIYGLHLINPGWRD